MTSSNRVGKIHTRFEKPARNAAIDEKWSSHLHDSLQWDYQCHGDYESGLRVGRLIARHFLAFMGSGQIGVSNVMLPAMMQTWILYHNQINDPQRRLYMDGQRDGFLSALSEFLVIAAYMNNCGLSEDNGFNPALITKPEGLA